MRTPTSPIVSVVLGLLASASLIDSARADIPPPSTTAFQLEQFEPSPLMGTDILNVSTSDVMPHLTPSAGILFHYVNSPFVLRRRLEGGGSEVFNRVVENQLKAEVAGAIGLFDIFALGFVMPVTVFQNGGDLGLFGRPGQAVSGLAMQDARIFVKARILNPDDFSGFGLHVTLPMYLPVGDPDTFHGDNSFRMRPTLGLEYRRDDAFVLALNVGYNLRPDRPAHDFTSSQAIPFSLGFDIHTPIDRLNIIGSIFGAVYLGDSRDPDALSSGQLAPGGRGVDVPLEVLGGIRYHFTEAWSLQGGVGTGLTEDVGSPRFRAFAGVAFTPTTRGSDSDDADLADADRDGDGFLDSEDRCPDVPGGSGSTDGCPISDTDGDGFLDPDDACPTVPAGPDSTDGCPNPDTDGDGICDPWVSEHGLHARFADLCRGVDNCPKIPEDLDGFEDDDGCPDPDNDGDGICDPWVDEAGLLPLFEGICEGVDKCPDQAETFNDFEDDDGCPDTTSKNVRFEGDAIVILQKVFFASARDVIKAESFPILNEVAKVLQENPWILKLRVEGHTDTIGKADNNLELSKRRAASVARYLTTRGGIDPARIVSEGYGQDRPIADNTTFAGRATNRRVAFTILEASKGAAAKVEQGDNAPPDTE